MERGRPSKYSDELADAICDWISAGKPLAEFCRQDGMPDRSTVYLWMDANPDFNQRIARARRVGYDEIAEDCIRIADDTSGDSILTEHGEIPNKEWIMRSKVRIETRLKLLSKWSPKLYGDKMDVTSNGETIKAPVYVVKDQEQKDELDKL